MGTARQITELLRAGHSYETAARELGLPPGFVFMVATGVAADASGTPDEDGAAAAPRPRGSTQRLVNPPRYEPRSREHVFEWVRRRARAECAGGAA